jgi:hypothetical protein
MQVTASDTRFSVTGRETRRIAELEMAHFFEVLIVFFDTLKACPKASGPITEGLERPEADDFFEMSGFSESNSCTVVDPMAVVASRFMSFQ